jgi:hypothetical protein
VHYKLAYYTTVALPVNDLEKPFVYGRLHAEIGSGFVEAQCAT